MKDSAKKPDDKKNKISVESYKGVRDFYPEDQAVQEYIFGIWKKVAERFGYNRYDASIIEASELYHAKSGEELVNEQTYSFVDRGGREVTLRPEMTPSVARMIAGKRREIGFPARWYSIPNLFRYERPQRGRMREHWQLNVDVFGINSIEADIEMMTMADALLKEFGASDKDFVIKVSSRKLLNALFANWYELDANQSQQMQKLIDRKAKMSPEDFNTEAEKIVGKAFKFLNLSKKDGKHSDDYEEAMAIPTIREAKTELDNVISTLNKRGIKNVEYDETLIRGFDYYTGIIFEVFDTNPKNNRSIFGGGRYDDLLKIFGEEKIPAVGFGIGDVTMRDFLETRELLPKYVSKAEIMLCVMDMEFNDSANLIAESLRKSGINVAVNYSEKKIGDQIKSADKQAIPYIVVVGPVEAESRTFNIKRLSDGSEITTNLEETAKIINFIK
ncbi:MAG: histidine--tRNA ligase [bacterium]